MYRKDLIERLLDNPVGIGELAAEYGLTTRAMAGELEHLRRSFRNESYRLVVLPAQCRRCGFRFDADKLTKPGKCPECRSTWIQEPAVRVERA